MSFCSSVKLRGRILILLLFLSATLAFNPGSTLAAKNRGAAASNAQIDHAQAEASQIKGQLIANGPVTVNGNKAITGSTVFTGSNIVVDCAKGNSAIVNLGYMGRIELVPGTKMTLRFRDGLITGDLQDGKAIINTPGGVKVAVNTPSGVVSADCAQACITPVAVQGFVQCAVVAPAAVQAPPPSRGLSGWAIAGIVAGAGAGAGAAAAAAGTERRTIPVTVVSPTRP
jgi:hypothetical protein